MLYAQRFTGPNPVRHSSHWT